MVRPAERVGKMQMQKMRGRSEYAICVWTNVPQTRTIRRRSSHDPSANSSVV